MEKLHGLTGCHREAASKPRCSHLCSEQPKQVKLAALLSVATHLSQPLLRSPLMCSHLGFCSFSSFLSLLLEGQDGALHIFEVFVHHVVPGPRLESTEAGVLCT